MTREPLQSFERHKGPLARTADQTMRLPDIPSRSPLLFPSIPARTQASASGARKTIAELRGRSPARRKGPHVHADGQPAPSPRLHFEARWQSGGRAVTEKSRTAPYCRPAPARSCGSSRAMPPARSPAALSRDRYTVARGFGGGDNFGAMVDGVTGSDKDPSFCFTQIGTTDYAGRKAGITGGNVSTLGKSSTGLSMK
jgi:hypothetical protein